MKPVFGRNRRVSSNVWHKFKLLSVLDMVEQWGPASLSCTHERNQLVQQYYKGTCKGANWRICNKFTLQSAFRATLLNCYHLHCCFRKNKCSEGACMYRFSAFTSATLRQASRSSSLSLWMLEYMVDSMHTQKSMILTVLRLIAEPGTQRLKHWRSRNYLFHIFCRKGCTFSTHVLHLFWTTPGVRG